MHTNRKALTTAIALMLTVALTACGGGGAGGGAVASTPPPPSAPAAPPQPQPPPLPMSIPAPPPPPGSDLAAPSQTVSLASPTVSAGSFVNLTVGTVFPLTITAVGPGFSGDATTTGQGAVLHAGSGGFTFTLNNSALGVTDARTSAYPPTFYNPDGLPVVAFAGPADDLDYTRYGYWTLPHPVNRYYDQGGGTWLGGYVTPAGDIPASGTSSYSGGVTGLASSYPTCGCDDFKDFIGDVQLTANFGTRAITGSMTNLRFLDMEFEMIPLNDVGFSAMLDSAANLFTGTTRPLTIPNNPFPGFPFAVTADAAGTISGRFFGPGASEVGAVWTLSDGVHRLIGSFGASRTGP